MNRGIPKLSQFNRIGVYLLTLFLYSLSTQQAHALCAQQQEDGNWANSDPNIRSPGIKQGDRFSFDEKHICQLYTPLLCI